MLNNGTQTKRGSEKHRGSLNTHHVCALGRFPVCDSVTLMVKSRGPLEPVDP